MRSRPYATSFLICERVLQEQDGVLSAIRIIDVVGVPELSVPGGTQFLYPLTILIMLKSDNFKGACRVTLKATRPSGKEMPPQQMAMSLEEGKGQNTVIQANIAFEEEGVYWFELLLNDEPVAKTPLSVVQAPKKPAESAALGQLEQSPSPKDSGRQA